MNEDIPQENTGIILGSGTKALWVAGQIHYEVVLPSGDWRPFVPIGEKQKDPTETMACTSFTTTNALETQEKQETGIEPNWSDRALAKLSGTTPQGNYVDKPPEAVRKYGLIKQEDWAPPLNYTWNSYYAEIPQNVPVGELLDFWWEKHAKHRNNKFEYLLPRLDKFRSIKARNLSPEMIQSFLDELLETLSPSSVNHYRTILNSAFNFAIKWKKYDDNPVIPIRQVPEREARDRFVAVEELVKLIQMCREQEDSELMGFVILAACTGMRKGEILPRKWSEVTVDEEYPFIYAAKTKNKRPKRLPLPVLAVIALRQLPSYGKHEYLFPAKPNVRFKGNFSKPYVWDLGKRFRRIAKLAGITDLRIHDLRHFATSMLFIQGVPDAIIRKLTGHRSEELERYKHLSPDFKQQSVEL